jgi:NAD(P)H-hydrate epimerase
MSFQTEDGDRVPAVTGEQMREVDRIAVEEFGLGILQMMENAGRNLAGNVREMLEGAGEEVSVVAGAGGNGGGALCCARHLHNRGIVVSVILDRSPEAYTGAAGTQLQILRAAGLRPVESSEAPEALRRAQVVVDGLIGYGLRGSPQGRTAELIEWCNQYAARVLSNDLPSGLNATTGEAPGPVVRADRTLTLALPKTGLQHVPGDLYLADIGIPPDLYLGLGLTVRLPFRETYWIRLVVDEGNRP